MYNQESRMRIAMDISEAITSAQSAAEGRHQEERMNKFRHCRLLLNKVIMELGLEKEWSKLGLNLKELKQ